MYLSRGESGRGLIGVQSTVETAISGLTNYVRKNIERLLIAARGIEQDEDRKTPNEYQMSLVLIACSPQEQAIRTNDIKKTVNVECVEKLKRA